MSVTAVPIQPTNRRHLAWLWIGVIVAIAGGIALAWQGTAPIVAERGTNAQFLAWNGGQPGVQTTASGLQYRIVEPGEGTSRPTDTDVALFSYTGSLRDGTEFDKSERPVPLPVNGAVPGFTEALKLMKKGAKYRVWIKPELAYGERSPDPNRIPNNALLVFDLHLVDFIPEAMYRQMMQAQMGAGAPGGPGGPPPTGQPQVPPPTGR